MEWKRQLIDLIFAPRPGSMDIETAVELKHQNVPSALYKYRSVTSNALKNLSTNTLWCANADQFNDPYDSALTFDFGETLLRKFLIQSVRDAKSDLGEHLDEEDLRAIEESENPVWELVDRTAKADPTITDAAKTALYEAFLSVREKESRRMVHEFSAYMRKGYKICSLSERNDSLPMWAHYAENHAGFAMEFNFRELPISDIAVRSVWPVIYSERLFDASEFIAESITGDFNNLFGIAGAIHKSSDWSYEKEWRIVVPLGPDHDPMNISVPTPSRVLLGAKITSENEGRVRSVADKLGVEVMKMEVNPHEFRMHAQPVA